MITHRLRDEYAPGEPITIENFVIDTINKITITKIMIMIMITITTTNPITCGTVIVMLF